MFINDVQAMLLQSGVSRMHFLAIWRPEFPKVFLQFHHGDTSWRQWTKQTVKKLNLCGATVVDKSAWIKAWSSILNTCPTKN